jgi:hypothetical protein
MAWAGVLIGGFGLFAAMMHFVINRGWVVDALPPGPVFACRAGTPFYTSKPSPVLIEEARK